jgi:uncharacterized protein (TIGR03437 family)
VKKLTTLLSGAMLLAGIAMAQPAVTSAVNAASYAPPALPNGGLARGSMFIIFGQRLGPATLNIISSFPLPETLDGTSVSVTVSGTTVAAYLIYTSAGQVAAILPSRTPTGNGTLTLTYNGQTSAPLQIRVVTSSFGTFAVNQAGSGPGIVQNVNSEADRPINALNRPARPGQTLILWGTGLGPVTADERAAAVPGDLPSIPVEVFVGGRPATITYRGRSGCCAGIDQIVLTAPTGVEGCYVPVVVKTGDVVSNFTTISLGSGATCTDVTGLTGNDIQQAQTSGVYRTGAISLVRIATSLSVLGQTIDSKTDIGSASFVRYDLNRLLASQSGQGFGAVSLGACTVYTAQGSATTGAVDPVRPDILNAGPAINITGPKGPKELLRGNEGFYSTALGGGGFNIPGAPAGLPDYLDPGSYTITGPGGPDVGAFSVMLNVPQPLTWTNMASVSTIARSQGQLITWSGGDPAGFTTISGTAIGAGNVVGGFACLERTSVGQFTIPSYVLLNLPPSSGPVGGTLVLAGSSALARFTATGLDAGFVFASSGTGKSVTFQ